MRPSLCHSCEQNENKFRALARKTHHGIWPTVGGELTARRGNAELVDRPNSKEKNVLYRIKTPEATAPKTTAAPATAKPRVVDMHSCLHLRTSKAAKACDAADAIDGLIILVNPTVRVAAAAYGVSVGSTTSALRLPPEEREKVRRHERPLVRPHAQSVPAASSATPTDQPVLAAESPAVSSSVPVAEPAPVADQPAPIATTCEPLARLVAECGLDAVLDLLAALETT
jgi:hypothetical protein